MTNSRRKMNALKALRGGGYGPGASEGVVDLLADLMHLCPVANQTEGAWEFDALLDVARRHFDAESREGGEHGRDQTRLLPAPR